MIGFSNIEKLNLACFDHLKFNKRSHDLACM